MDEIEVYKIINGLDRASISKFFTIMDETTNRYRLNVRTNIFSNRVVNAWNSLPNGVVLAASLNSFKSRLNRHWHGHVLKLSPSCHIPGETRSTVLRRYQNRPLEVV